MPQPSRLRRVLEGTWRWTRRLGRLRQPKPVTAWNRFPNTWLLWPLLLTITAAGGWLRFWRIDQQSYWYDEGQTIERICGTWDQMLQSLAGGQGFPPGWYALLYGWRCLVTWWTGSAAFAFSPAGLRLLPALFGTLTIPAMYLLARQFTDRKGALLVALLTAVNPYLIYYSRDIKMYMALWFFVALHVGLFFQWLTTQRHWLWWPLVVLSGVGVVAMHAVGAFIFAIELIWLIVRPRLKALDGLLWMVAIGLICLLPLWWYLTRNQWVDRATTGGPSGVEWNKEYTSMEWTTLWSLPTAHLLGYLWPRPLPDARLNNWFGLGPSFDRNLATRTVPWVIPAQVWVAIAFGAIMLLGLLPWRGFRTEPSRRLSATRGRWWYLALWIGLPVAVFALTWIPTNNPWYKTVWGWYLKTNPRGITPLWEPRYLGIIIPAWILWLATSLRRLPTWPLRTLAILFVLTASTASSLVNHLLYRQNPWGPTARALLHYWDPKDPNARLAVALGTPNTRFPLETDQMAYEALADIPPTLSRLHSLAFLPSARWERTLDDSQVISFLDRVRRESRVKVIVLTDRSGDLKEGPLTSARLTERMGPAWKLVYEETYGWYYEWRYYFFHTWRTRVWLRQELPAAPLATRPLVPPRPAVSPPATLPASPPASRPATAPATSPGVSAPLAPPAATAPSWLHEPHAGGASSRERWVTFFSGAIQSSPVEHLPCRLPEKRAKS